MSLEDLGDAAARVRRIDLIVIAGDTTAGDTVLCAPLRDGTLAPDDPSLRVLHRSSFLLGEEAPPRIGHLPDGRALFLARAWDEGCFLVGDACAETELVSGRDASVELRLGAAGFVPDPCPASLACVEGECRECAVSEECDDDDPCTADTCEARACEHSPSAPDADGDGHVLDRCGGDDCDDGDDSAYPGAARACGRARDHDCDDIVDDLQGCGVCSAPIGLARRGSIAAAAWGVYAVGADRGSADPFRELYVVTRDELRVYAPPDLDRPLTVTAIDAREPTPPEAVGDIVILPDKSPGPDRSAVYVYSRDDLRAGDDATPIAAVPGYSTAMSVLVGPDLTLVSTGAGELLAGQLVPDVGLASFGRIDTSEEWPPSTLARAGATLFGVRFGSIAAGELVEGRLESVHDRPLEGNGGGADVQIVWSEDGEPLWVGLAHARGVVLLEVDDVVNGSDPNCCPSWVELALPDPCGGEGQPSCEEVARIVPVGPSRLVALTSTPGQDPIARVYLLDLSGMAGDPPSPAVLDVQDISDSTATGRDLAVSGTVVLAVASAGDHGVVDLLDLQCP